MHTILLVDDEPAITESLAFALGRGGFEALSASTLAEADARLAEASPALIILDLMLPDGNGLDWLRGLRGRSAVPVIILSSHDDPVDHIVALEIGADDYIDKPFSPREVVARVRAVLRRAQPGDARSMAGSPLGGTPGVAVSEAASGEARVAPEALRVDADRRQAWGNGVALPLSRLEFDLLTFLLDAPGRVFTRDHLLDRVWGPDANVTDRTVDVHVKTLRKKLVLVGLSAETIETVRGVGYRLAEGLG